MLLSSSSEEQKAGSAGDTDKNSHYMPTLQRRFSAATRVGSKRIDIEVSSHHMVSVSNFQSIEVSSVDWIGL